MGLDRAGLRFPLAVLLLLALALGLRVFAMERAFPIRLVGDELYYASVALHIAREGEHRYRSDTGVVSRALRPPAHPFVLSLFADAEEPLTRGNEQRILRPLVLSQVALGTLLVALTAWLGCALFDARTGALAGLLAVLYPTFIAHSHYLWSETLFAVLASVALLGVVATAHSRRWSLAAATGLAFGVATLSREVALPVAGVCGFWWWWTAPGEQRRLVLGQAALMLGIALLVVLPWTLRNYALLGRFVPVSTIGWYAAGEGNALEKPNWLRPDGPARQSYSLEYFEIRDELERLQFARRRTFELIRADQPFWIFKKTLRNLALFWSPDSYLFFKIRRQGYEHLPNRYLRALETPTVAVYVLIGVLTALGVAASGPGRRSLPCLVLGAVSALHVLANAAPRFRVPWMPLLMVYASSALLTWPALPQRLAGRRWIPPLAVLIFFLGVCVPYFYVFGGRR